MKREAVILMIVAFIVHAFDSLRSGILQAYQFVKLPSTLIAICRFLNFLFKHSDDITKSGVVCYT